MASLPSGGTAGLPTGLLRSAVDDDTLESMTQQLLQVSTVFLMQQNELQEVKERLQKELQRVTQIQEALTEAAASHQEAVLTMIQNYENLTERRASPSREASPSARRSTASSIGELGPAEIPGLGAMSPMRSMSIPGSGGAPRDRRASVRTVHLPPVQREVQTFKQEPLPDEGEDEGIRYVDNLKVEGGLMGVPCKGSGDFVGTPACQWYRERTRGEVAKFVAIVGATGLEFAPTADHVGARLRLGCTGPYGGPEITVDTAPIALESATHAELLGMLQRGQGEFNCTSAQLEPRVILVTRKNIKVRKRLEMGVATTASTIYKQPYSAPLTAVVDADDDQALTLRMSQHSFPLTLESPRARNLAVVCIRMFAGPACPTHYVEEEDADGDDVETAAADDAGSDGGFSERPADAFRMSTGAPANGGGGSAGFGDGGFGDDASGASFGFGDGGFGDGAAGDGGGVASAVQWSDEEKGGEEEEEFRPIMKITMRAKEDVKVADSATLKSFSLGMAPPKGATRARGRIAGAAATCHAASAFAHAAEHAEGSAAAASPVAAAPDATSTDATAAAEPVAVPPPGAAAVPPPETAAAPPPETAAAPQAAPEPEAAAVPPAAPEAAAAAPAEAEAPLPPRAASSTASSAPIFADIKRLAAATSSELKAAKAALVETGNDYDAALKKLEMDAAAEAAATRKKLAEAEADE